MQRSFAIAAYFFLCSLCAELVFSALHCSILQRQPAVCSSFHWKQNSETTRVQQIVALNLQLAMHLFITRTPASLKLHPPPICPSWTTYEPKDHSGAALGHVESLSFYFLLLLCESFPSFWFDLKSYNIESNRLLAVCLWYVMCSRKILEVWSWEKDKNSSDGGCAGLDFWSYVAAQGYFTSLGTRYLLFQNSIFVSEIMKILCHSEIQGFKAI